MQQKAITSCYQSKLHVQLRNETSNELRNRNTQKKIIPASSVRVLADGGLGSPIPTALLATTRNSYSTQALRLTTVAVRVLPTMTSGTGDKVR